MEIPWGSIIGAGASLGSALIGARAADKAGEATSDASNRAVDAQMTMYAQNREDLAPYRDTGVYGLGRLRSLMENPASFTGSPGYQFRLGQGVQAIDRAAAAKGMLGSGARLKALTEYGQGLGSQEYGNEFNRLAALAGVGQAATNTGVASGQATAGAVGSAQIAGGQARGSAYLNQAGAINNGLANLAYLYGRQ